MEYDIEPCKESELIEMFDEMMKRIEELEETMDLVVGHLGLDQPGNG